MTVEELRDTQMERLRATVRSAVAKVPFYRRALDEAGLAPDDLTCHGDACDLPFTTKIDLRDHYPFGMFAAPREELVRVHASSGTTGNPTTVGYTAADVSLWADLIARTLAAGGMKPGDMLQNAYGYGLFTGGLGLHYGCERLGATILPISGGNTDRQLKLMRDFGVTALSCTPSYALYLAEAARDRGLRPDDLPIRVGYHGAEPWSNEMRRQIEEGLGIDALDIYGLSEMGGPGVAFECRCKAGMHVNEDHYLVEIVDPHTLEQAPEGTVGELVVTTLSRVAQPLIRYRTRDLCSLIYEPCECGRTMARMTKPVGRSDDMLIIRGVNVFPSQIEEVLMTIPQIEPHYQIVVDRKGHLDMVEVWIEVGEDVFGETMGQLETFERGVQQRLYSVLNIQVKVKLKEPRTIARSEGKAVRVIDKRPKQS
ncbi:MAG TPA: phenylacetate--CoA ligase [Thermoleophilia bacterium]|nr:phenylacetate--CoA ligase [Thermoleophilia bacterium]